MAGLVGLGSAALVFFVLKASDQTECHRESVEISIAYSTDSLQGCPFPAFNAVRRQVTKQRTSLPANDGFTPDEPDSVRGEASLVVVWISLLSATAGLAGISAVRSPLYDLLGHEASVAGIDQQHSGTWRSDPPRLTWVWTYRMGGKPRFRA